MNAVKSWCTQYKLLLKTGLLFCFLLILGKVLLWLGYLISHHQSDTYHIELDAPHYLVNTQQILDHLHTTYPEPFLNLDLVRIRETVGGMPWVKSAIIQRQWPNTLYIKIQTYQPIAKLNQDAWLDANGRVFKAPARDKLKNLPHLIGSNQQSKRLLGFYQTAQSILSSLELIVSQVELTSRNSWQLKLKNGLQLILGRESRIERLERFVYSYPQLKQNIQLHDWIDLRYDSGIAIGHQKEQER